MKYTALIREVVTRDIRVILDADSKGQAKRIATSIAAHGDKHRNGILAYRRVDVNLVLDSIEPLTRETNDRIQKELRA